MASEANIPEFARDGQYRTNGQNKPTGQNKMAPSEIGTVPAIDSTDGCCLEHDQCHATSDFQAACAILSGTSTVVTVIAKDVASHV